MRCSKCMRFFAGNLTNLLSALCILVACQRHHPSSPDPVAQPSSPPPFSADLHPSHDPTKPDEKNPTKSPTSMDPPTKEIPSQNDIPVNTNASQFLKACTHIEGAHADQPSVDALRLLMRRQESLGEATSCQMIDAFLQKQTALVLSTLDDGPSELTQALKAKVALISTVSLLRDIPSLAELTLVGTNVSDFASLSVLKSLTSLTMHHQTLTSLAGLSELSSLTELRLGGAKTTQPTGLGTLSNLRTLALMGNDFASLAPLLEADGRRHPQLEHLTEVNLSHNHLADLHGIENLPNLTSINLDHNQVASLEAFGSLLSIKTLSLVHNQIGTLAGLDRLPALIDLNLASNKISVLRVVMTNELEVDQSFSLLHLNLTDNPLRTLEGIEVFTKLTGLNLDATQVTDLQPLRSLSALNELSLRSSHIESVLPLQPLSTLRSLDLSENKNLSDVLPLAKLPIETLNLAGTGIGSTNSLVTALRAGGLQRLHNIDLRRTDFNQFDQLKQSKLSENRARQLADCVLFQAHHGLRICP